VTYLLGHVEHRHTRARGSGSGVHLR
jgi:hypothetical protein